MVWSPDNSSLLLYKAEIEAGKIIVGQDMYQELKNLHEDIRSGKYVYDTEDALLRQDFMENCIKLTKSPFYGKPMQLMLWQKAFIEALYSFKMPETMVNRFKRAVLELARKNGKSELCSAIMNAEFIVGPEGADLVCSSNDDNQASIVYDAIDTMRSLYDPDDVDTGKNQRFILNKQSNTKIFKLSDRTRNKEGRNIDKAIVDEAHEMKTNSIVKPIEQSQSIKESPWLIIISTEGFVADGFFDEELDNCRKILYGEDDSPAGERTLPWLYTQDSELEIFTNKRSWYKSNPSLGVIKRWDYLEEQVELARASKADRVYVLTKDFNVKQNGSKSWLAPEEYTYAGTFNPEDLRGCFFIGEVDLAETTDLTCAMALVLSQDGRKKYLLQKYFIPEAKLDSARNDSKAGAKYEEWVKDGYITISGENETILADVAAWFWTLQKEYGLKLWKCGYDQRFANDWLKAMDEYGWSPKYNDIEMIQQNAQTLSNAVSLVEAELRSRNIIYNENPVTRWCFSNACLQLNGQRQSLVVKTSNDKKIDGAVTLVSLFELFRRYKSDLINLAGRTKTGGT